MTIEEIVQQINIKKDRAKAAIDSPAISKQMKDRVLHLEYMTYVLALEGAKALKQRRKEQGLSDTAPVTTVPAQMD